MEQPNDVECIYCHKNNNEIVCNKCRKETRAVLKNLTTYEDFINFGCLHPLLQVNGLLLPHIMRQNVCGVPLGGLDPNMQKDWDSRPKSRCYVCRDEMRKELTQRKNKNEKTQKIDNRKRETLVTLCCRAIASDPGLILEAAASQREMPVPNHLWEKIYEEVPRVLTPTFNAMLDASIDQNDAHFMYSTIGEVFYRYVKRRKGP